MKTLIFICSFASFSLLAQCEDDYKLMSLYEIEQFIKANSHLPEVPSEAEVEENGIELAAMNAILLKKIEEMTLHLIAMEKRIAELETE